MNDLIPVIAASPLRQRLIDDMTMRSCDSGSATPSAPRTTRAASPASRTKAMASAQLGVVVSLAE